MCLCNSVLSSTGCQLLQFCSCYSLILELNHCPLVNCGGFSKLLLQMKFLDSYCSLLFIDNVHFMCRFISFPTYYTRLIACNCQFDPIHSQTDNIQIPFYHDLDKPKSFWTHQLAASDDRFIAESQNNFDRNKEWN